MVFWTKISGLKQTNKFWIFLLDFVQNFRLNWSFRFFGPNLLKNCVSELKQKNEHHQWILLIPISKGNRFQLKLEIWIFWTKWILNIQISLDKKFQLKQKILIFWPICPKRIFPVSNNKKWKSRFNSAYSSKTLHRILA